jgi:N-acetylmuramic acid 6-phosphate etherase
MAQSLDLSTLVTEQINPASVDLDARPTLEMLRVFNDEDRKVALAVEQVLPRVAAAVDGIAERLRAGGRLFYIGAGTSGRLGVLDASECPPTFNVPPGLVTGIIAGGDPALKRATEASEDDPAAGARDLDAHGFTAQDALVGLAASGRTPYVLGAIEHARRLGALTIGVACAPQSALGQSAEIAIDVPVGPEVITGSTRLKSGTAQKLVLNMISSGVMVRLGYVFSNLMVNVQPRNEKLVDRAQRIIMAIAGVERAPAAQALEDSGRNVRIAIVMARLGLSRDAAVARLAARGGRVREALQGDPA